MKGLTEQNARTLCAPGWANRSIGPRWEFKVWLAPYREPSLIYARDRAVRRLCTLFRLTRSAVHS
jgi:hypothetical protein